ncbi:MAG TPA: LLM class flavin-dependent oxidoreductase [Longimicrobiales bacterium]
MRISVLDQSPISEGSTGVDAVANTLDLARLCEDLGYHRYWVAEHHGTPMLAGTSPEILIAAIGAHTKRIRVGSGGVMLPHYSPLKVAEVFSVLSALYPERVDLGLGRASGTDPMTTLALQRDRRTNSPDDFPQQLVELLAWIENRIPAEHPFARVAQLPGSPAAPEPWLLGSSPQSGIWAAELGLPYAFADFINPEGAAIARRYREGFQPSHTAAKPHVMVCSWVVCADTDEEARVLASSAEMSMRLLFRGQLIPVPSVEKAQAFLAGQEAEQQGAGRSAAQPPAALAQLPVTRPRRRIVGAPATVRAKLDALLAEYEADELMVVTITYDHNARRRSYELVAQAMGIQPS